LNPLILQECHLVGVMFILGCKTNPIVQKEKQQNMQKIRQIFWWGSICSYADIFCAYTVKVARKEKKETR